MNDKLDQLLNNIPIHIIYKDILWTRNNKSLWESSKDIIFKIEDKVIIL